MMASMIAEPTTTPSNANALLNMIQRYPNGIKLSSLSQNQDSIGYRTNVLSHNTRMILGFTIWNMCRMFSTLEIAM